APSGRRVVAAVRNGTASTGRCRGLLSSARPRERLIQKSPGEVEYARHSTSTARSRSPRRLRARARSFAVAGAVAPTSSDPAIATSGAGSATASRRAPRIRVRELRGLQEAGSHGPLPQHRPFVQRPAEWDRDRPPAELQGRIGRPGRADPDPVGPEEALVLGREARVVEDAVALRVALVEL